MGVVMKGKAVGDLTGELLGFRAGSRCLQAKVGEKPQPSEPPPEQEIDEEEAEEEEEEVDQGSGTDDL